MLRQNPFISIISIIGTALAITMVMSMVVADEVKTMAMGPEKNRDRMLYVGREITRDTVQGSVNMGSFRKVMYDEYISKLETPELVGIITPHFEGSTSLVWAAGSSDYIGAVVRGTDHNYWKAMTFSFVEGRPYSEEEYTSGVKYAVISRTTSRRMFASESALGKSIEIDFKPFTVIGVVEDVSPVFSHAHGDVWMPVPADYNPDAGIVALILAKHRRDFPKITHEVRECEKKYRIDHAPWVAYFQGPDDQQVLATGVQSGQNEKEYEDNKRRAARSRVAIIAILLLVPAVNLSGFSLSRIKKRTAEIGIRKAFGARKYVILTQVLYENMITSLIGGVLGLLFSYVTVYALRHWLLSIPAESQIPVGAFFSPFVFVAVFIVCLLINLVSAGLPAYKASRMSIVDSLTQNDR